MVLDYIADFFQQANASIPTEYQPLFSLLLYTIFIAIYAIFIWKFYKFLASKSVIQLNLRQYNYSKHPAIEKFFAVILYTVEYLVILPFLVIFWFAILSLFLLLLSKQNPQQILLISAAIIAATRMTAYLSEDLARDIAKILPFTVLAAFLIGESFFDTTGMINKISQIPGLFSNILMFIVFIFVVEFILRLMYSVVQLASSFGGKSED